MVAWVVAVEEASVAVVAAVFKRVAFETFPVSFPQTPNGFLLRWALAKRCLEWLVGAY